MITISRISTPPTVICTHVYISLCIRSLKFNGSGLHPGNGAKTKHNCDRAYIQRKKSQFLNHKIIEEIMPVQHKIQQFMKVIYQIS